MNTVTQQCQKVVNKVRLSTGPIENTSSRMVVSCLYELSFTDFDSADPPAHPPTSLPAFDIVKFTRYQKHFNSPVHWNFN